MSPMWTTAVLAFCISLPGPASVALTAHHPASTSHVHKAPRTAAASMRTKAASQSEVVSPWKNTDWEALARKELARAIDVSNNMNWGQARNVIMFLGDGMGVTTTSAARLYNSELNQVDHENIYLAWEKFPHVGMSRTYCVDRSTPDSAATGTAYLCGIKANYYTLGVTDNVTFNDCPAVKNNKARSIVKDSVAEGKWTGVVTTTRITHASPAAGYAHVADRNWEGSVPTTVTNYEQCEDIALQLVTDPENQQIRVILGGGRQNFLPSNVTDTEFSSTGQRTDGRDLIQLWKQKRVANNERYAFVQNKTEFDSVDPRTTDYLMGLFSPSHMDYELDRIKRTPVREPSLADMTEKAIRILQRGPKGFFLFVEGGRIDHSHHDCKASKALNDTLALSQAVQRAVNLTSEQDTLIVVTADHSHVFTYGGYASFGASIFGFQDSEEQPTDGKPNLQMNYANGPGYYYHRMVNGTDAPRMNLTGIDTYDAEFLQDSGIPLESETHGGEDVNVYARGPMSHLFHGVHEQNYIAHVMKYASCVGRDSANATHCNASGYWTTAPAVSSAQRTSPFWW